MRYNKLNHKWAVIQEGYCIFGTGRTRKAALNDVLRGDFEKPVFDMDGNHVSDERCKTIEDVEEVLNSHDNSNNVHGAILLTDDPDQIRSYVESYLG